MLLAVDIGNTNIHIGVFDEKKLLSSFYVGTDKTRSGDEYAVILKALLENELISTEAIDSAIIGSVCPGVTQKLQYAVKKITSAPITMVGPGVKTGYSIKLDDPSQLGADLVANSSGAIDKFGYPVIIIDFGTATTISAIDKNKSYSGCYIMPGIQMSLDSLNSTGLLPSIVADENFPVLAKNSADSMKSGVIFGQIMAVEGFVDTYKRELDLPSDTSVLITGGFSDMLLPYFRIKVKHVPTLTLEGLNTIQAVNKKKTKRK
ncbi:MAG: type III pantothenate kinase [Clostridia bacterium]|nr:type III pantothenate kinase [Clostridia bacterium]